MEIPRLPTLMASQKELEESWRLRLEEALCQYHATRDEYHSLLAGVPDGVPPNPDGALARARQAESMALAEYRRVLQIFTDLTIHGKLPEDQSASGSRGA